jgi:hypothetical protein
MERINAEGENMDITIEQIDQLTSRTGVSYKDAKAALEAADGDLLEALIALERDGKTGHQSAAYSTNGAVPTPYGSEGGEGSYGGRREQDYGYSHGNKNRQRNAGAGPGGSANGNSGFYGGSYGQGGSGDESFGHNGSYSDAYKENTSGFGDVLNKIWRAFLRLFHRGNINHFEVFHRGQNVFSIPTTALVLLLIFGFWFVLPALVIGLFFGCRYRFRGPDLGRDSINRAMDSAGETAENLKQTVRDAAEEHSKK